MQERTLPASSQQQVNYYQDDEIDLRELFGILWQRKKLIISITLIGLTLAVIIALTRPVLYQADSTLIPSKAAGQTSSALKNVGFLASMAGVNLGGSESDNSDIAMQLLKTRQFTESFINEHQLLPQFYAAKGWNKKDNRILINPKIYDEKHKKWVTNKHGSTKPAPDTLLEYFNSKININLDNKSNTFKLTVKHFSPLFAKEVNDLLITYINNWMRDSELQKTNTMINMLKKKINETSVAENQSLIYKMLDEQRRKKLLATGQKDYVFQVLDPAAIPIQPISRRRLIVVLGVVLSFMLACFGVLVYEYVLNKDKG